MTKRLKSGVTLVVDRYSFSGVAYSASKPVSTKIIITWFLCEGFFPFFFLVRGRRHSGSGYVQY